MRRVRHGKIEFGILANKSVRGRDLLLSRFEYERAEEVVVRIVRETHARFARRARSIGIGIALLAHNSSNRVCVVARRSTDEINDDCILFAYKYISVWIAAHRKYCELIDENRR